MNEINQEKIINKVDNLDRKLKKLNSAENMNIIDVDYYLSNISSILEKNSYSINSRMFIDNLINILDNLNKIEKFNRSIFTHIMEFGHHKKDSIILLYLIYYKGWIFLEVILLFMNQ